MTPAAILEKTGQTPSGHGHVSEFSLLSPDDLFLFNEGSHLELYRKLGAHRVNVHGVEGTYFAVWAPNAERVSVIGDFNGWDRSRHPLCSREQSGIWEGFLPGLPQGALYKFHVRSRWHGHTAEKSDPFGFCSEAPPRTASVVWDLAYDWHDREWMEARAAKNSLSAPIAIYEMHLGSWRHVPEEGDRPLTYRELAEPLIAYLGKTGFTHVEFLPVMEHPLYRSWGYQSLGYFAPTRRYGDPQGFMYLIDRLHQAGFGVILDWVPSHFPLDGHGLAFFDGTHLYEHADPKEGFHPDWKSAIFNYGRHEVRSFLLSSALYWLDVYHADALRVDAVASMLYRDYGRREGEWIPNQYGGRENLEAIAFLRRLSEEVYKRHPDVQVIAEESTAWPGVSRPTYVGGLGFGLKWDMGWMHDTLQYLSREPVHRKYHHGEITFRGLYAFFENFVLPLSHDEVVHGKGSLLAKMPGDDWQKFANLRLLLGYMYAQPGKKLLFMGSEFGQWREWNHESSLEWHLLQYEPHQGIQRWVADLNALYRREPALHLYDADPVGFQWISGDDGDQSVLSFLRLAGPGTEPVLIACNFTPVVRHQYRLGVPTGGMWQEILNSDAACYGGSNQGNLGSIAADVISAHGQQFSLSLTLPPLAVTFLTITSNHD